MFIHIPREVQNSAPMLTHSGHRPVTARALLDGLRALADRVIPGPLPKALVRYTSGERGGRWINFSVEHDLRPGPDIEQDYTILFGVVTDRDDTPNMDMDEQVLQIKQILVSESSAHTLDAAEKAVALADVIEAWLHSQGFERL